MNNDHRLCSQGNCRNRVPWTAHQRIVGPVFCSTGCEQLYMQRRSHVYTSIDGINITEALADFNQETP